MHQPMLLSMCAALQGRVLTRVYSLVHHFPCALLCATLSVLMCTQLSQLHALCTWFAPMLQLLLFDHPLTRYGRVTLCAGAAAGGWPAEPGCSDHPAICRAAVPTQCRRQPTSADA
jgi:hypothetical protein